MLKNYQILADSASGHDTYVWNPRRADWVEMSKDDGEYTTFSDKAIAESHFENAKENCGYLKNVRIVEYEVEVEEESSSMKVKYIGASEEQITFFLTQESRGVLVEGELYEVDRIEEHSWHTRIYLKDYPGRGFNSVCFEDV